MSEVIFLKMKQGLFLTLTFFFLISTVAFALGKSNAICGNNFANEFSDDSSKVNTTTDTIKKKQRFDIETGLDLPSNFIKRKHFEVRGNSVLYTQTALYNAGMNRLDDPYRYTYATGVLKFTYGVRDRLNVGVQLNYRQSLSETKDNPATDIYTTAQKYKTISNNILVFAKFKIWERRSRISALTSVTIPVRNQLPDASKIDDPNIYVFKGVLYYDRYITSFLRTTISMEGDLNYNSVVESTYFKMRPGFNFSSILIQKGFFKATVGMNLYWNLYSESSNFTGIEYATLNFKLSKKINISTSYNYYFIGAYSGAGHSFNLGLRYFY